MNFLNRIQFGLRPQRGTTDSLLAFTEDVYTNFQKKNVILATMTDLEAEFDKIPHSTIVQQSMKMNIKARILKFISYFSKAEQFRPI